MTNPYDVLGVPNNASLDEVKKAYKAKAAMYADNYSAMEQINEAYDAIVTGNNSQSGGYSRYYSSDDDLGDIRSKLNAGRIDDAETLLDGIPVYKRNAEWYFLKGTILQRRGWLESAAENFQRASELEPDNREYQRAYENIKRSRSGEYRNTGYNNQRDNDGCCDSPCKMCSGLLCADCCCECMGGDLIRCC